jgi:hypothetical protein
MRIFHCACGAPVFFENVTCIGCRRDLGFLPDLLLLSAVEPANGAGEWKALAAEGGLYRRCENYTRHGVCNWMVGASDGAAFCVSCRLNETIPNLDDATNRSSWAHLEAAKRRLVYSLLRLGLPLKNRREDPAAGLAFAFLANPTPGGSEGAPRVVTGHAAGLITINVAEADDVEREQIRRQMHESYRTLLGHFRHEIGHYYFGTLVEGTPWQARFRRVFGDERVDYAKALDRYYAEGAPPDWQGRFISVYASAHPHEDWAETWAHYLHLVDTIETSRAFGIVRADTGDDLTIDRLFGQDDRAALPPDLTRLLRDWVWLTLATNAINRSMGMKDVNPFVLNANVAVKLGLVHELIASQAAEDPTSKRTSTARFIPVQLASG